MDKENIHFRVVWTILAKLTGLRVVGGKYVGGGVGGGVRRVAEKREKVRCLGCYQ